MKRYPKEVKDFIAKNVTGTATKDLVELVNAKFGTDFTESKMKSYKQNHELKSGTPLGLPAGRPTKTYPEEIKKFITENHIGVGPKSMAELLNKTFGTNYTLEQLRAYYKNHGLKSGVDCRFSKGHVPINKGKKCPGQGGVQTQFQKGNKAHNWVPIGTERVNGDGYIDIKVQDGTLQKNWRGKHIIIWGQHNGPVPKGCGVIFGDGNNRNFDPDNLILVSRPQLAILNTKKLIQNDANLTRSAVIVADVFLRISERKKGAAR